MIKVSHVKLDKIPMVRSRMSLTVQSDVIMLASSDIRPLMALLLSTGNAISSPHRYSKCATLSANHSVGAPEMDIRDPRFKMSSIYFYSSTIDNTFVESENSDEIRSLYIT